MTLGEAKTRTLKLLDEYSAGGVRTVDRDIELKMHAFFDMAQKDMASHKPIVKCADITLADNDFTDLPTGFVNYYRVWKDGKQYKRYPIVNGKMYTKKESGTITLEYISEPTTIDEDTPDTYVFEVSEDAANCLPFYVAAQQLITDLVIDYSALWNMYLYHKGTISSSVVGGATRMSQKLFSH